MLMKQRQSPTATQSRPSSTPLSMTRTLKCFVHNVTLTSTLNATEPRLTANVSFPMVIFPAPKDWKAMMFNVALGAGILAVKLTLTALTFWSCTTARSENEKLSGRRMGSECLSLVGPRSPMTLPPSFLSSILWIPTTSPLRSDCKALEMEVLCLDLRPELFCDRRLWPLTKEQEGWSISTFPCSFGRYNIKQCEERGVSNHKNSET